MKFSRIVKITISIGLASLLGLPMYGSHWNSEILDVAKKLPVQDSGRVKPLDTLARFKLLRLNGKRKCTTPSGQILTPVEWLFDCIFFPEAVKTYRSFLIQNDTVLDAIGVSHDGRKKRDRYSFNELVPGRKKLFVLAHEYVKIEPKKRDPVQSQIVILAENIMDFERLAHYLDFARESTSGFTFKPIFPNLIDPLSKKTPFSSILEAISSTENNRTFSSEPLLQKISRIGNRSTSIALFPPTTSRNVDTEWMTPADLCKRVLSGNKELQKQIQLLHTLEKLVQFREQPVHFKNHLREFQEGIKMLAEPRNEYSKIPLEVMFYKGKFFYYSLLVYVLSFLLIAISWLKLNSRILDKVIPLSIIFATGLLVTGITMRCIIRSRPPVSTLYETILFITAITVIVGLVIEYINRQKIAIVVCSVLGCLGLFLANKFEIKEGTDTMTSLVAVLDSNYWLSIHVTTVTIGYAAGLLAGAIAHIYIVGKALGLKRDDHNFYKSISRMTYGVICFGLFFSVVGTILGGLWANDSWGRFWGWDPKENGALMIILWELAIIHGRFGGLFRDLGVCMSAVFGACIVAFSWWGVNLLGVGLHSYGFASGIMNLLMIFYGLEAVVLFNGFFVWRRERLHHHLANESSKSKNTEKFA